MAAKPLWSSEEYEKHIRAYASYAAKQRLSNGGPAYSWLRHAGARLAPRSRATPSRPVREGSEPAILPALWADLCATALIGERCPSRVARLGALPGVTALAARQPGRGGDDQPPISDVPDRGSDHRPLATKPRRNYLRASQAEMVDLFAALGSSLTPCRSGRAVQPLRCPAGQDKAERALIDMSAVFGPE